MGCKVNLFTLITGGDTGGKWYYGTNNGATTITADFSCDNVTFTTLTGLAGNDSQPLITGGGCTTNLWVELNGTSAGTYLFTYKTAGTCGGSTVVTLNVTNVSPLDTKTKSFCATQTPSTVNLLTEYNALGGTDVPGGGTVTFSKNVGSPDNPDACTNYTTGVLDLPCGSGKEFWYNICYTPAGASNTCTDCTECGIFKVTIEAGFNAGSGGSITLCN